MSGFLPNQPRLLPDLEPTVPVDGATEVAESVAVTALGVLNSYAHIFVAAFVVTLLATPLVMKVAFATGAVDRPDAARKAHRHPVAYLGGLAVFLGLVAAVALSYVTVDRQSEIYAQVPLAIVIGMVAIVLTGLADDLWGWDPRLKLAGQLVAAAGLAMNDIGVRVAEGMLTPFMGGPETLLLTMGSVEVFNGQLFYWLGTALIGLFVLGGCNASNLIDGLDGLLAGVVAIVAVGFLAISLLMIPGSTEVAAGESLAGARVVLCVALLGAVLGFLPYNFNPATIFLGDCGSLLIGYVCVVIILLLGENGQTHLVFAGLIIFALPIMDTTLAIIRRWLAGASMSAADDQHIHHQLKRSLGGVRRAVLALYVVSALFATLGISLAWLVMRTELRVRVIYAIALVLFSFVGVIAVKAARRQQRMAAQAAAGRQAAPAPPVTPAQVTTPAVAKSAKHE